MSTTDEVDVILLQETLNHGFSKRVADTAIVLAPAALTLFGVGPKQVAEKTILRHLSGPRDLLQLGHSD